MQKQTILIASGAFGLGALFGWAATSDVLTARFKRDKDVYEKAISSLETTLFENFTANYASGPFESENELVVDEEDEFEDPNFPEGDESEKVLIETEIEPEPAPEPDVITPKQRLQLVIDRYTSDPDAQEEFRRKVRRANDRPPHYKAPHVISQGSFAYDEECDHYEKITLTFYEKTRLLLDDDQDVIDDVDLYVGWRNLNQFGFESNDPDVVFIRNDNLMVDYEVIRETDEDPPQHVLLGMDLEEFKANKAAGRIRYRPEDK